MYAVERQRWIVERARADGRIEVSGVCDELGVAPETARRDLNTLELQGLVRRVHGGAIPVEGLGFEGELTRRTDLRRDEKARMAAATLPLLANADSVYLDEGSSVQALAQILDPQRTLTVVTNALPTASALSGRRNVRVLIVGGRLRERTLAATDHWATRMITDLVVDVTVLGTNGCTVEHGLTCPDESVAAVKAAALASGRRTILLADRTKFGVDSFCRFARVQDVQTIVTDRGALETDLRRVRALGVDVIQA